MDWRGRAAATGARAKRQGSRQAACAAQSVVLGRLSVKRISRSWAKSNREREGADKGRKQARGGMWEGNSRAQNIEREELRGLLGRGLAVRVYVCVLGWKRGCVCAVVRALRSCACPEKGSREGVRVSLGRERASVWAGACLCVSCVFVCVAA